MKDQYQLHTMYNSVTHDCDSQCTRRDAVDHLVDLVGVNPETIKGTGSRELDVGLG